jgi:hypothetical protein
VIGGPVGRPAAVVERWFTTPEPHAAGRMGIVRILYGLFCLWHVGIFDLSLVAGAPDQLRSTNIVLADAVGADLTAGQLRALDAALVVALTFLVLGLRTRAATVAVLVLGLYREIQLAPLKLEDSNPMLVFVIPLFMAVAGRWGDTYSLDARARRRRGGPVVDPDEDGWSHFLAARAVLVVLAVLFSTAALCKVVAGGTWISQRDLLTNLMLERNVKLAEMGLPGNPLAPWIADHLVVGYAVQLTVVLFEGTFLLALVHRDVRAFYVATALVFHAVNEFELAVSFTPVLITYALFVDWQALLRHVPFRVRWPVDVSDRALAAGAVLLAGLLAATWRAGAHALFDLGGMLTWRTLWIPVLPLALWWSTRSALRIARDLLASVVERRGRTVAVVEG